MSQKITIIGAGEIGRAIEYLLKDTGAEINLWDKDTSKVSEQRSLDEIVPQTDFIFLCVPSWAMRPALTEISPYLKQTTVVVSLAKGIEKETHKTMDEIISELLPQNPLVIIAGAMLAEEIMEDLGGTALVASGDKKVGEKVIELFKNTSLKLYYSDDIRGAALSSVLKNIYAFGLGIAYGLGWGDNMKSWLLTEALNEMRRIVKILDGKEEAAMSVAGLGDLTATGYSKYSKNHAMGEELVKTGKCSETSEGYISISSITFLLGEKTKNFSLLLTLSHVILEQKDCKSTFENFIE
jgi:glycerol-3-phosphate dehydrogenase (NAD(P)+)